MSKTDEKKQVYKWRHNSSLLSYLSYGSITLKPQITDEKNYKNYHIKNSVRKGTKDEWQFKCWNNQIIFSLSD